MSIQGNINQILGNIGVLAGLGDKPGLKGMAAKREFKTAKSSLKDITKNMQEVAAGTRKPYEAEEMADIEKRRRSDIGKLYDIKTEELGGGVYGKIVGRESAKYKHEDIAADINLYNEAVKKIQQKEDLKNLREQILKGTPSEPKTLLGGK